MFPPLIYVFHNLSDTFSHIVLKLPINNKKNIGDGSRDSSKDFCEESWWPSP